MLVMPLLSRTANAECKSLRIIYVVGQYWRNLLCEGGFDSLSSDFAGSRPLSSLRLSDSVHHKQDVVHLSSFHYTDDECNKVQRCCGLDNSGLPCLEHSQVEQ